jgi:hypothetical protein
MSATALGPGTYAIEAYAHSTVTGTFNQAQTATITIPTPNVRLFIDRPAWGQSVAQPFAVTGWAIDTSHPTASGVDFLHIYASPWSGAPATFLGQIPTGGARPDVGGSYGARFTPSGWGVTASGLAPGWYWITVYPHSTVTDSFRYEAAVAWKVYVQ